MTIECMSKRNFKFHPLHPILRPTELAERAAASTSIEAVAPSRRAERGQQKETSHEIIEDRRPGCRGLAPKVPAPTHP